MTAEIGILNKSAVALAADSAVTVTVGTKGGRKTFNTANKIFHLSKTHPVGLMIYNSASFAGIPWETLVKMYRNDAKEKPFDTLGEYIGDFIKFVRDNLHFVSPDQQIGNLHIISDEIRNKVNKGIQKRITQQFKEDEWEQKSAKDQQNTIRSLLNEVLQDHVERTTKIEPLKAIDAKSVLKDIQNIDGNIRSILKDHFSDFGFEISEKNLEHLILIFSNCITKNIFLEPWSGVVIAGFGESEIFPSICSIRFGSVFRNHIRYQEFERLQVAETTPALITPFAQRDMIDTFIQGLDPLLYDILSRILDNTFQHLTHSIVSLVGQSTTVPDLPARLENIRSQAVNSFMTEFDKIKLAKHIDPIIQTVASLSKEDMAEMAESLINLTYLKRRISFEEETVGGPIDVALITKGDGLIWVKRKHYFKPELNYHFISRDFK